MGNIQLTSIIIKTLLIQYLIYCFLHVCNFLIFYFRSKDGEKIQNTEHTKISGDVVKEIYKLYISNIGLGDDGLYTVTATNSRGETSQTAKFHVHSKLNFS